MFVKMLKIDRSYDDFLLNNLNVFDICSVSVMHIDIHKFRYYCYVVKSIYGPTLNFLIKDIGINSSQTRFFDSLGNTYKGGFL